MTGGGAGRRADFLTSPAVGPLFGAVVARAVDTEWERCGRPDPWLVVEAAAGDGSLAAAVLAAGPVCAPALRYVAVEVSPALRAAAAERLPVELPVLVLGPSGPVSSARDEDEPGGPGGPFGRSRPGRGPLVTVLSQLPAQIFTGMIVANELLDNLPFDLLERRHGTWWEVLVGEVDDRAAEVLVPAAPADAALAERLVPEAAEGARIPLQRAAASWLATALELIDRGRLVCIDYCSATTAALADRPQHEWLRTYRRHGRGTDPLADPGNQDVTCEVAVDQLARVRPPTADHAQAAWLAVHGLDELVAAARAAWGRGAASPDLAALAARSRIDEASALTDPAGMGAFRVLEWELG